MNELSVLRDAIGDQDIIRYFYLDIPTPQIPEKLDSLTIQITPNQNEVPFNAQVKGYIGGVDTAGDPWILKPTTSPQEAYYHRTNTIAFILDHWMGTLSAPTTVVNIEGKTYRAVKTVRNAMQISSYDYLDHPFIDILRADLVNRWLYFDEDRNPNNYLVIQNSKHKSFIVAIDFDKVDLEEKELKITGTADKFGWIRGGKNRFLTLLRPENFEGVSLECFEHRLSAMKAIPETELRSIVHNLMKGFVEDTDAKTNLLVDNFTTRREYIDSYFRKMFKPESETDNLSNSEDYSMFGASFLDMYGKKN